VSLSLLMVLLRFPHVRLSICARGVRLVYCALPFRLLKTTVRL